MAYKHTAPGLMGLAALVLVGCGTADEPETVETVAAEEVESAPLTAADLENSLIETVGEFEALFTNGNMGDAIDFLPPRLPAELIKTSGVTIADLKENTQSSWETAIEAQPFQSVEFDLETTEITEAEDGMFYKIIPTTVTLASAEDPEQSVETASETLAVFDGEDWFIVRLNGPAHANYFKDIYPEFAEIELAAAPDTAGEGSEE